MTRPEPTPEAPSTFASRRAEREAREAAGEKPAKRNPQTFRVGHDAPSPDFVVTHVRA